MRNRRGVALVLVLWLIVVLGATTAAAVALSRSEANTVVAYRSRAVARAAAASGVELAVARLNGVLARAETVEEQVGILEQLRAELDVPEPRELGAGRYLVGVEDLSGRVAINHADYVTLLRLFEVVAGERRAATLAAAVMDWLDWDDRPRPDGAESTEYAAAGSPYRPLNRPFQRIEELGRVLGIGDSLAAVLDTMVTVHGRGFVNVNTAPVGVLMAATGMDASAAEELVAARRGGGFRSMDQVRSAMGETGFVPVSVAPTRLLVTSRGWAEGRPFTREIRAVLELRGWGRAEGPEAVLIAWEERDL